MTILQFKPRHPAAKSKAIKASRAKLELKWVTDSCRDKLPLDQSVVGRLLVGEHAIEARDGSLLGLAAFVANVGSVEVHTSSMSVVVLSGSRKEPQELLNLRGTAECAGESVEAERQWAEYWLLKKLHVVLQIARNSKLQQLGLLESWEREKMTAAAALVPPELRVNSRFPRAPGYAEDGSPLKANSVEKAARSHRLFKAFSVFSANKFAHSIEIPWDYVSRSTSPDGPVAINGPAYVLVQRMLLKWQFPRMPTSYAELWTAFQFCEDLEMLLVHPFGGPIEPESVKFQCTARRKRFPETSALFETCIAGDEGAIGALQQQRDWLAVLATQFVEAAEIETPEE